MVSHAERGRRVEAEAERHELEMKLNDVREVCALSCPSSVLLQRTKFCFSCMTQQRLALAGRVAKLTSDINWYTEQQHKLQADKEVAEALAKGTARHDDNYTFHIC